jgi:hypothetical protein
MLVDPAWFTARGVSLEQARAEALQADRATALECIRCESRRWYTHGVLPPDPRPRDRSYWDTDPWDPPDDPLVMIGGVSRAERRRRMWE